LKNDFLKRTGSQLWKIAGAIVLALHAFACIPSVTTYSYRVTTASCNCSEYKVLDRDAHVGYTFKAAYRVHDALTTIVTIEFTNHSKETLMLDPGSAMVSSKTVGYEYNAKFVPLPQLTVAPGKSEEITLTGTDAAPSKDEWNKIAGEELTLTIKDIQLGGRTIAQQSVKFVPENPHLK
jgi:hypothetical protein